MKIAFCSIDTVQDALRRYDPDALVSIFSPRWPPTKLHDRPHLGLAMHDVETVTRRPRTIPPLEDHIESFIEFAADHMPRRLLIHCTAGLSRAPAFAIVGSIAEGRTPQAACVEVRRLAPQAQPNRRVLDMAETVLKVAIVKHANAIFSYTRTGLPDGERTGLCILES